MPTVNIFFIKKSTIHQLQALNPQLKKYITEKLSGASRTLTPSEISIRYIQTQGSGMIADIELEITAHAYPERVKNQDRICLEIAHFIKKQIPAVKDVEVWLKLSQLGHSWQGHVRQDSV